MKMRFYVLFMIIIFCGTSQITFAQSKPAKSRKTNSLPQYNCLPKDISLNLVISAKIKTTGAKGEIERENVKQRLDKLDARCRSGKLVDGKNRGIRFYRLTGCWGNPPDDYQEILEAQQKELEKLKKKYTVIEITCNPSGEMLY